MEIVLHLAMTAAELEKTDPTPPNIAFMACHFSPYGTGLSNLPSTLPEESLLILNDRTPINGHDPDLVARQLTETAQRLGCKGILLDFQRHGCEAVAAAVAERYPKVAVTPAYADKLECAVFLPPPPPGKTLSCCLAPWQGRPIWLEAAPTECCIRITEGGSIEREPTPFPCPHVDEALHCRYGIEMGSDYIDFHLQRDLPQLSALLAEAAALGVQRFVGLYQQLGDFSSQPAAQDTARCQS